MKEQAEDLDLQTRIDALEAKVEQEQRLRDELISTTSHDLRSPIGAINIFCEILMSGPHPLEESQKQNVKMIAEAAEKLQRIVEDTVDIARLHSGRIPRMTSVDPSQCVASALEQLKPVAEQRGVALQFDSKVNDVNVKADANRLTGVFVRIISEAIRSTPRDSALIICEDTLRGHYILTVSGKNTSARTLPADGNAYFPKGKLGLRKPGDSCFTWATCERLVELLGGSIVEEAKHGYRVELALPLQDE